MKNKNLVLKFQIASAIFTMLLGTLLHFTYNWSNNNLFVGAFSAVNESTWEHLKLMFFPILITIIIGYFYIGENISNFLCAKTLGIITAILFTIVFFYTYTGILGTNFAILNIATFLFSVVLGEYIAYRMMLSFFSCNKKIAIIGLGVSNLPLLDYFYNLDSKISVFDNRKKEELDKELISKLDEYGIDYYGGENNLEHLVGYNIIFRSPSLMPYKAELKAEEQRGAIITSEIEMVLKLTPSNVIGITGTKGKTTTTSIVYEIIKQAGYRCFLGGNIGKPIFTEIENMRPEDVIVLELSSFQLTSMDVSPQISVVTNIFPDHLNVHSSYEEYIDAKKNIFKYQKELNNPLMMGYLLHLITDKFYNTYMFENFFIYDQAGNDIGLKIKGKEKILPFKKIKYYKHREFDLYDKWLLNNNKVPSFTSKECIDKVKNIDVATFDRERLSSYIDSHNKDVSKNNFFKKLTIYNYKLTTKKDLDNQLELCLKEIINYLNKIDKSL